MDKIDWEKPIRVKGKLLWEAKLVGEIQHSENERFKLVTLSIDGIATNEIFAYNDTGNAYGLPRSGLCWVREFDIENVPGTRTEVIVWHHEQYGERLAAISEEDWPKHLSFNGRSIRAAARVTLTDGDICE
jgi:hypothetical protein